MNITTVQQDQVIIFEIGEKHLDAGNVEAFRETVSALLEDQTQAVFDLSKLEFMDSSGLGAFLSCMRILSGKGGTLCLCGVTPAVQTLFGLVRMHRIMDIYNTREEAVRAIQG